MDRRWELRSISFTVIFSTGAVRIHSFMAFASLQRTPSFCFCGSMFPPVWQVFLLVYYCLLYYICIIFSSVRFLLNYWLTAWSGAFGVWQEGRICGDCFKYKFFRCDGRRGTFSFYRKICKLAPILISGKFDKYFTFMPLALCDGTTAQLQICSSERNVPLLPVGWR